MDLSQIIESKKLVHAVIRELFRDVRGHILSSKDRAAMKYLPPLSDLPPERVIVHAEEEVANDAHLTYGEVTSQSFQQMLLSAASFINSSTSFGSRVFYDLGSGTGRAVLTAALGPHGFGECFGIELLPALHESAQGLLRRLKETIHMTQEKSSPSFAEAKALRQCRDERSHGSANSSSSGLLVKVEALLRVNEAMQLSESLLANALCRQLGAKRFKASLLPYKSFHSFLLAYPSMLFVDMTSKERMVSWVGDSGSPEMTSSGDKANEAFVSTVRSEFIHRRSLHGILAASPALSRLQESPLKVEFSLGDFLVEDCSWWADADCAFAASLLFSDAMMVRLQRQVERMKPGSVFISLKPFNLSSCDNNCVSRLVCVSESFYQMSWQKAIVYMYKIT